MHVVARGRQFLARHPSVHWLAVAACAALAAWTVHHRVAAIDAERDAWGSARTVLVAEAALAPGEPLEPDSFRSTEVPVAVAPDTAVADLPAGARLHRPVGAGEILVADDLTAAVGPAGRAEVGTVVVGFAAPDGTARADGAAIGSAVRIVADGVVLATDGVVVDRIGSTVFVAVPEPDGASVAAAERNGSASIVYVPR